MKQKLTNTVISNFTCPEGKQKGFLSDTEVSGLKLRVTASGAVCGLKAVLTSANL